MKRSGMNPGAASLKQPAFLICVAVLAVAAGGMDMLISYLDLQLKKLPLPLRKSLDELDESALQAAGYRVVTKTTIDNADVLEALGTEDYIQWTLQDERVSETSPVRYCAIFVTYYTGNPDQVPHVPEECYFGGGYQRLDEEGVVVKTGTVGSQLGESDTAKSSADKTISARCLTFGTKDADLWQAPTNFRVLYFFKVNGEYAGSREQVRAVMNKNLFSKYSYYSKVEWRFFNVSPGGAMVAATKEQAVAASSRMLTAVVNLLEKEHWPDWEAANAE